MFLSADDLDTILWILCRKPSILAADDFLGACYRKAKTSKKLWTLLSLHREVSKTMIGRYCVWNSVGACASPAGDRIVPCVQPLSGA